MKAISLSFTNLGFFFMKFPVLILILSALILSMNSYSQCNLHPDRACRLRWETTFTNTNDINAPDWIYATKQTSDGNFISVGYTSAYPYFEKLDITGRVLWRTIFDESTDGGKFVDVIELSDGSGYVAIGYRKDHVLNPGLTQYYLYGGKVNTSGTILSRRYFHLTTPNETSTNTSRGTSIHEAPDGNVVITGTTDVHNSTGTHSSAFYVFASNPKMDITYDVSGPEIWYQSYGENTNSNYHDWSAQNCCIENVNSTLYYVYAVGSKFCHVVDETSGILLSNYDGGVSFGTANGNALETEDADVYITKLSVTNSTTVAVVSPFPVAFNSAASSPCVSSVSSSAWKNYNTCYATYNTYTPGNPGTDCANGNHCGDAMNWFANNSQDVGYYIAIDNTNSGRLIVGAQFNRFELANGNRPELHSTGHGTQIWDGGTLPVYDEYRDADVAMMRVNKTSAAISNVKRIAHVSGGDFNSSFAQDCNGNLYMISTSGDCQRTGAPNTKMDFYLVKTNNGFNNQWGRDWLGNAGDGCAFGINITTDGGLITCGNGYYNGDDGEIFKLSPADELDPTVSYANLGSSFYTVGTHEVWPNGTTVFDGSNIKNKIIIPANHELDITGCTLHFAYSRDMYDYNTDLVYNQLTPLGIYIQPGGRLILDRTVLTGMSLDGCTNRDEMWDGITVEGDPGAYQTSQFQGYVSMSSSTIQNAVEGLFVDGSYFAQSPTTCGCIGCPVCPTGASWTLYFSDLFGAGNLGGGIVQATSSSFLKNRFDVGFTQYNFMASSSNFTGCTFNSSDVLVDPNYADQNGHGLGANTHVSMWDIHGIYFNGCTVNCNSSFPRNLQGRGIVSFDASYYVNKTPYSTPCTFSNLETAIDASGSMGSPTTNIDAEQNIFSNCQHGVNLTSTVGAYIWGNQFYTTTTGALSKLKTWAVFAKGSNTFKITENTFDKCSGCSNYADYGAIINNSVLGNPGPPYNAYLHKNPSITNVRRGAQFEIKNTTLQAFCNTHSGNAVYDWDVCPVNNVNNAMAQEGENASGTLRANNNFDVCSGSLNQIRSSVAFNYYDKAGNADITSTCISATVSVTILSTGLDCLPLQHRESGDGSDSSGSFSGEVSDSSILVDSIHAIMSTGNDTAYISNLISVVNLLEQDTSLAAAEMLVPALLYLKSYDKAKAILNTIPASNANLSDYKTYYNILLNAFTAGKSIFKLNDEDYKVMVAIADGDSSQISGAAQSLLNFVGRGNYILIPQKDADTTGKSNSEQRVASITALNIYPNPANSSITIGYTTSAPFTKLYLCVYDLIGQKKVEQRLTNATGEFELNTHTLPEGIYICTLEADGRIIKESKVNIYK